MLVVTEVGWTTTTTPSAAARNLWSQYPELRDEAATVAATDAALEASRAEIELRRDHPGDYGYTGYVLRRW